MSKHHPQTSSSSSEDALRRTSKVFMVPIPKMRVPPAGIAQREFRPQWGDKLAKELELGAIGIPVMNLRGGIFWVIDGQHRIYALKENGLGNESLECEVFEDLTDEQMAAIFRARNTRKSVAPIDNFLVACTAGDKRALSIRRAVESNQCRIGRERAHGQVSCVQALGKVYDAAGESVLGQVVRTIRDGFEGDEYGFDAQMVQALGMVYNRYNGRTNEKQLIARLSDVQHGPRAILRRGAAMREKTGNLVAQCIAAVIVETYNKGAKKPAERLPSWWSDAS